MLIISRKPGDSFIVNENIEIRILEMTSDRVKIGIEAPKNIIIVRKELLETKEANIEAVTSADSVDYAALKKVVLEKKN